MAPHAPTRYTNQTDDSSFNDVTSFFDVREPLNKPSGDTAPQSPPSYSCRRLQRRQAKVSSRKKVAFDFMATEVHEIPHASEYTDEEHSRIWSSRREERANREACMDVVALMDSGMTVTEQDDGICTRGLEAYTEEYVSMYQEHMAEVYSGIRQLQNEHEDTLESPETLTAKLAGWLQEVSDVAHHVAHEIALDDEAEAAAVHAGH